MAEKEAPIINPEVAKYFNTSLITGKAYSGKFGHVDLSTISLEKAKELFIGGFPYLTPTNEGLVMLRKKPEEGKSEDAAESKDEKRKGKK